MLGAIAESSPLSTNAAGGEYQDHTSQYSEGLFRRVPLYPVAGRALPLHRYPAKHIYEGHHRRGKRKCGGTRAGGIVSVLAKRRERFERLRTVGVVIFDCPRLLRH